MEVEFAAAHRYKQILKRKSKVFITYVFIDAVSPLKVESSESENDKLIEIFPSFCPSHLFPRTQPGLKIAFDLLPLLLD
jgi:hypothetical protein